MRDVNINLKDIPTHDIHKNKTTGELLAIVEFLAANLSDGHLTILRFTTEWKVLLGTPATRGEIEEAKGFDNLRDALVHFLEQDHAMTRQELEALRGIPWLQQMRGQRT